MATRISAVNGNAGYRHQLDRARRFLDRATDTTRAEWGIVDDVWFQDLMWAFFQNCWHVKDWIRSDLAVPVPAKDAVIELAHKAKWLPMCQGLCNGTKHLSRRLGAAHHHVGTTIVPGYGAIDMDCIVDDGRGKLISGKQPALDCIAEWESILQSQGLATARLS